MFSIRLPDAIEQRLAALASETGRTKTALAREAILHYIDASRIATWLRR